VQRKSMCALNEPPGAPGVAQFSVAQPLPPIDGHASIVPNVPPPGAASPCCAPTSSAPFARLTIKCSRSAPPGKRTFVQKTTSPSSLSMSIGLRENARPKHSPPATGSKNEIALRQLPGLPANKPDENVVGVGL